MKKVLCVVVAIVALLLAAPPVLAIPPEHFVVTFDEAPWLIADCGGYTVETDALITIKGTTFLNKDGEATRVATLWQIDAVYSSPETGVSATMNSETFHSVLDVETGEQRSSGVQFHLVVPGAGTLLIDAGRLVFDDDFNITFAAGPHPVYLPQEGDLDRICAYFAG